jgi:hypothetical protein
MINHVRTLLMNVSAATQNFGVLGEEILPTGYVSKALSSGLQSVRTLLFGTAPDRWMLNYRLQQFMPILHASPLVEFVVESDPRTTYDPNRDDFFLPGVFEPQVRTHSGGLGLTTTADVWKADITGRVRHAYRVTIASETHAVVRRTCAPLRTDTVTIESGLISLPGSGRRVRPEAVVAGSEWTIEFLSRPLRDPAQILMTLQGIGEPSRLELFGIGSAEPYATFRNLWEQSAELPLKLGSLLLALARRTEERGERA